MGKHGASHWDTDWDAAIAPGGGDSLYGAADAYQPVNEWSGVYSVPQTTGFYDYDSYTEPQPQQPVMDQTYYESIYASYSAPPVAQPVQESSPTWDGPAWQDPYMQLPQPQPPQPQQYATPEYWQPQHEQHNFHHPEFDTGEFEAIYAEPGSTEASYDLLPEGEGAYDAYDGRGYGDDYDLDYYEDDDTEAAYDDYSGDADDDGEDPDDLPIRSRSRSGNSAPAARPPFGTPARNRSVQLPGKRTLHAITSTPAAVVGVAAVAVAAVGGLRLPDKHPESAPAADQTPPTTGLEANLLQMRAASATLADRATRSEQRTELSQQQALEKQRLAEMAPKYFLPVDNYILSASFGDSGAHWATLHTGQDFAVPSGTKVVAVTDGNVIMSGWAGPFGYRIVIQHPDGSETWYCHLSYMKVRSGPVKAGQVIALSGDTGNSTGPHLHFEYHPPGTPDIMTGVPGATAAVNPMPFLRSHGLVP